MNTIILNALYDPEFSCYKFYPCPCALTSSYFMLLQYKSWMCAVSNDVKWVYIEEESVCALVADHSSQ